MELDGKKLRAARERRFWSQQTLANNAGKTEATINRLEQGKQRARPSTILEIAGALGVDPLSLVRDENSAPLAQGAGGTRPGSADVDEA